MSRNIEVTDEQFALLRTLQEELKTQDNRSTRDPIFYYKYREDLPTSDDYADGYCVYSSYDDHHFDSVEEFLDWLKDKDPYESKGELWGVIEKELREEGESETAFKARLAEDVVKSYWINLGEAFSGLLWNTEKYNTRREVPVFTALESYKVIPTMEKDRIYESGCFSLFAKDLEYHKTMNSHNFNKGTFSYAGSIQRAPLMEGLLKLLKEVTIS